MTEKTLIGLPTAPGIAIGKASLYLHDEPTFRQFCVMEDQREREIARLDEALEESSWQIKSLHDHLVVKVGDAVARIFDAQNAILEDVEYIGEIRSRIKDEGLNAEAVVYQTTEKWWEKLSALEDELFRQRAQDVRDVGRRIIKNLLGVTDGALESLDKPAILVADNLLPSDVVHLLRENIQGIATDLGGETSHTAILTRALEVPAVVGLNYLTRFVNNGDSIIVNGNSGKVIVQPGDSTVSTYIEKRARYEQYIAGLSDIGRLPATTTDGRRIFLRANLELPQEVKSVITHGGEGVGLFRSEYLFLTRHRMPSEEEQIADYTHIIEAVAPHPVTIRTFDLGGDKIFPNMPHPVEANPFMGWRAIRVSLDQPQLFHTQLRAILRSNRAGHARIMFPFISDVREVIEVKEHLETVKSQLISEGIQFDPDVKIGVMIELPSAVLMADKIAREVDFFSIGTNDLTQFTLAVDRGNERVRNKYRPLHPAMIKMIKMTVKAGHAEEVEVAICGELAASPLATMLLVGLDLDELSVSPVAIPEVKKIIRSMSYSEAKDFARDALEIDTADELIEFCVDVMRHRFANLPIWFNEDL